ncbi:MAG TPA: ATP-binding protein, partial [Coriobacteriia bacterium]|nr:ATP-binding protein [Coriobacteriia bacterium]
MSISAYDELLRVARAVHASADTRSKPFSLDRMDLPTLYSLRAGSVKQQRHDTAVHVCLEIVDREVATAKHSHDSTAHSKAILAVFSLVVTAASGQGKLAVSSARAMCRNLVAGLEPLPKWARDYIRTAPQSARPEALKTLTGLTLPEWNALAASVVKVTADRQRSFTDRLADEGGRSVDLNVAARLLRLAAKQEKAGGDLPSYDTSDRDLRLSGVTVRGFRGSAGAVTLDLTRSGKPVDVLLWGDNGTGKSTLVDGIEFALQRRVDRSADFNSSLRSSVRNLNVPEATAAVTFSDGTAVERGLVTNRAGRDEPSHLDVRPGFRIAPVVI